MHPQSDMPRQADYRLCAVIPVYNHGATVTAVVDALQTEGLPCIVVDDGSRPDCAAVLDHLATRVSAPTVTLVRRAVNGGKGAAVQDGLRAAAQAGFSHSLQVDADGQHELADVAPLMALSRQHPQALIGGLPQYGDDVPRARLYGRWLTRIWVWINTLSRDIPDAMCGFRIYPLAATVPHLSAAGQRMDFDIALLVHLHWAGVPMHWLPTQVRYPADGISHFRAIADNVLISRMHARLFFGMLWRAPRLVRRSRQESA